MAKTNPIEFPGGGETTKPNTTVVSNKGATKPVLGPMKKADDQPNTTVGPPADQDQSYTEV